MIICGYICITDCRPRSTNFRYFDLRLRWYLTIFYTVNYGVIYFVKVIMSYQQHFGLAITYFQSFSNLMHKLITSFVLRLNSERYNIHKNFIVALFLAQTCLLIGMNITAYPVTTAIDYFSGIICFGSFINMKLLYILRPCIRPFWFWVNFHLIR